MEEEEEGKEMVEEEEEGGRRMRKEEGGGGRGVLIGSCARQRCVARLWRRHRQLHIAEVCGDVHYEGVRLCTTKVLHGDSMQCAQED